MWIESPFPCGGLAWNRERVVDLRGFWREAEGGPRGKAGLSEQIGAA